MNPLRNQIIALSKKTKGADTDDADDIEEGNGDCKPPVMPLKTEREPVIASPMDIRLNLLAHFLVVAITLPLFTPAKR